MESNNQENQMNLEWAHDCFGPIVSFDLNDPTVTTRLDLSNRNSRLSTTDFSDCTAVSELVFALIKEQHATIGIGGYLENRAWYQRTTHFTTADDEPRCVHLGVDIWAPAGSVVYSPCLATVHSIKNNSSVGDYGPTVILAHTLGSRTFHTLYGHLSLKSLNNLAPGQILSKGQEFASIGAAHENGDWPPHLHFQIVNDMCGKEGDFFGVSSKRELDFFKDNCPDPNSILRSVLLST